MIEWHRDSRRYHAAVVVDAIVPGRGPLLASHRRYHEISDRTLEGMSISTHAIAATPGRPKAVAGGLGSLALAVLTIVTVFKLVSWSAAQTALATAETAAIAGLVTAVISHLKPGTSKEPVAVAATFTATVSATLALGSGFGWWHLTVQETSAVAGLVTAILGVGGALLARTHVTASASPRAE
jgi:hypothetical protein